MTNIYNFMIEKIIEFKRVIEKLFDNPVFKSIGAFFLTGIGRLFGENNILFEALSILIVVDFITGIMASLKVKKKITSWRMIATAYKIIIYALAICAAHQVTRVSGWFIWFDQFIFMFLTITELISILENLSMCGLQIPRWVFDKLKKYLSNQ